jgi:hypothetical protein
MVLLTPDHHQIRSPKEPFTYDDLFNDLINLDSLSSSAPQASLDITHEQNSSQDQADDFWIAAIIAFNNSTTPNGPDAQGCTPSRSQAAQAPADFPSRKFGLAVTPESPHLIEPHTPQNSIDSPPSSAFSVFSSKISGARPFFWDSRRSEERSPPPRFTLHTALSQIASSRKMENTMPLQWGGQNFQNSSVDVQTLPSGLGLAIHTDGTVFPMMSSNSSSQSSMGIGMAVGMNLRTGLGEQQPQPFMGYTHVNPQQIMAPQPMRPILQIPSTSSTWNLDPFATNAECRDNTENGWYNNDSMGGAQNLNNNQSRSIPHPENFQRSMKQSHPRRALNLPTTNGIGPITQLRIVSDNMPRTKPPALSTTSISCPDLLFPQQASQTASSTPWLPNPPLPHLPRHASSPIMMDLPIRTGSVSRNTSLPMLPVPRPPTPSKSPYHGKGVDKSSRSKSNGHTRRKSSTGTVTSPRQEKGGFINYTSAHSHDILRGVAPSGSSKTKARREREAAEQRRKLGEAAKKALREAGLDARTLDLALQS